MISFFAYAKLALLTHLIKLNNSFEMIVDKLIFEHHTSYVEITYFLIIST